MKTLAIITVSTVTVAMGGVIGWGIYILYQMHEFCPHGCNFGAT
jgi:hypothetical protein